MKARHRGASWWWIALILGGSVLSFELGAAGPEPEKRYLYAIQSKTDGRILMRGVYSGRRGIRDGALILQPGTEYRFWTVDVGERLEGFVDFVTGSAGERFKIPKVGMRPPIAPDLDGDGLSSDAEMVIGTNPSRGDSDGDGVSDGDALRGGGDALLSLVVGVVDAVDTPGNAQAVATHNDLALVADAASGVQVFNIFNTMRPVLVGQVGVESEVSKVVMVGNRAAVAGDGVVTFLDLSRAPEIARMGTVRMGAEIRKLEAAGSRVLAVTESRIYLLDLETGTLVSSRPSSTRIVDVLLLDDRVIVIANPEGSFGRQKVLEYRLNGAQWTLAGEVLIPVASRAFFVAQTIFAAGNSAYLGGLHRGEGAILMMDLSMPGQPRFIGEPRASFTAPNFSPYALGGTSSSSLFGWAGFCCNETNAWVIGLSNGVPTNVVRSFAVGQIANDASLYNGLVYVASGWDGLIVLNPELAERAGERPSVALVVAGNPASVVEGTSLSLLATVTDDRAPRNVEFYVGETKVGTDGSIPYELMMRVPSVDEAGTLRIRARASDRAGRVAWSEEVALAISRDTTPPAPLLDTEALEEDESQIRLLFDERLDPATVNGEGIGLVAAGPDGTMGTSDDLAIPVSSVQSLAGGLVVVVTPGVSLRGGRHAVKVGPGVADERGNHGATDRWIEFTMSEEMKWSRVSAGVFTSAAIGRDGSLWTWGLTGENGSGLDAVPRRVNLDGPWMEVSTGRGTVSAVKRDGTLWQSSGHEWMMRKPDTRFISTTHSLDGLRSVATTPGGAVWLWDHSSLSPGGATPPKRVTDILKGDGLTPIIRWLEPSSGDGDGSKRFFGGWAKGGVNFYRWQTEGDFEYWNRDDGHFIPLTGSEDGIFGELWDSGVPQRTGYRNSDTLSASILSRDRNSWFGGGKVVGTISRDGGLYVGGSRERGQTGGAATGGSSEVIQVVHSKPGGDVGDFVAGQAGHGHVLALTARGQMYALGQDEFGETGTSQPGVVPEPRLIGGTNLWLQVSAGRGFSLALDTNGICWATGYNGSGQLGIGSPARQTDRWTRLAGDHRFRSISAGEACFGITSEGKLVAWGSGVPGAYTLTVESIDNPLAIAEEAVVSATNPGLDPLSEEVVFPAMSEAGLWRVMQSLLERSPIPGIDLDYEDRIVQALDEIVLGSSFYSSERFWWVPLRSETQELLLSNPEGSELARLNRLLLEDAYSLIRQTSSSGTPVVLDGATDWKSVVATATNQALALKNDGTVWQVDLGRVSAHLLPEGSIFPRTNGVLTLHGGGEVAMMLRSDGEVVGFAPAGGEGSGLGRITASLASIPFTDGVDVTALAASGFAEAPFAVALDATGRLLGWGARQFLPGGGEGVLLQPEVLEQTRVWKSVELGAAGGFAISNAGELWRWGEIGKRAESIGAVQRTNPMVQVGVGGTWQSVSTSHRDEASSGWIRGHVLAIDADGHLWGWGDASRGQLGLGRTHGLSQIVVSR